MQEVCLLAHLLFYAQKLRPGKAASRLAATPLARLYCRRRGDTEENIAGSSYG